MIKLTKSQETLRYLGESPGTGGQVKSPEDFIVEEIVEPKFLRKYRILGGKVQPIDGKYTLAIMRKRLLTTEQAVRRLSFHLKVNIGYAGLKDKFAVTSQYVTFSSNYETLLQTFRDDSMSVEKIGRTDREIAPGDLASNRFTITLHNAKPTRILEELQVFPNYYGPQRFGKDGSNAELGRLIIQRRFDDALKKINDMYKLRFTDIRQIDKKRLKFFVHAYQSLLFNEMLAAGKAAIIPGYSFVPPSVRKTEGIREQDFKIRELSMSFRGGPRDMFVQPKIEHSFSKGKLVLKFTLPRGAYATSILREITKREDYICRTKTDTS
ncbi:MAG: tRNA pseudouridine(13) synthase TruD [Candidatus Aenigmarchaeota archaeon]|nr:tRNA pseudouridine(13) synthase TruD [Candidatus Aenigmarchaeota archaeon]